LATTAAVAVGFIDGVVIVGVTVEARDDDEEEEAETASACALIEAAVAAE
jgi:hypothetical protein